MSDKRSIDGLQNINTTNLVVSNSFSISPYLHTFKDIVTGSFSNSSAIGSGVALDNQTQSISNVASSPNSVILTVGTPSAGTHNWDRVMITQSGQASSYNSSTGVYTLGYNLFNINGSATSGITTIFYLLRC